MYRRSFSNALVLVNIGTNASSVDLGGSYLDPDSGTWRTSISVPAGGGRILLKRNITSE